MRTKLLTAVVFLVAAGGLAQAGLSISVLTEKDGAIGGQIYTVDVLTGKATKVGAVGDGTTSGGSGSVANGTPNSLGFSNPDYFYTSGGSTSTKNNQTVFHYKTAGSTTEKTLTLSNVAGGISGADAKGDTFYYFSDGNGTTKSTLGTVTNIFKGAVDSGGVESNIGNVSLGDLAVAPGSGPSYIAYQDKTNGKNYLGTIDLTTGFVTANEILPKGDGTASRINGLAFAGGKVYATSRVGLTDVVSEVTGGPGAYSLGTAVTINGFEEGYRSTDAAAVPVPPVAAMALGALVGVPMLRRFRKAA